MTHDEKPVGTPATPRERIRQQLEAIARWTKQLGDELTEAERQIGEPPARPIDDERLLAELSAVVNQLERETWHVINSRQPIAKVSPPKE